MLPTSTSSYCWCLLLFLMSIVIFLGLGMTDGFNNCILDLSVLYQKALSLTKYFSRQFRFSTQIMAYFVSYGYNDNLIFRVTVVLFFFSDLFISFFRISHSFLLVQPECGRNFSWYNHLVPLGEGSESPAHGDKAYFQGQMLWQIPSFSSVLLLSVHSDFLSYAYKQCLPDQGLFGLNLFSSDTKPPVHVLFLV